MKSIKYILPILLLSSVLFAQTDTIPRPGPYNGTNYYTWQLGKSGSLKWIKFWADTANRDSSGLPIVKIIRNYGLLRDTITIGTADSVITIDTTKIGYLAKTQIWSGGNQYSGKISFTPGGLNTHLQLPNVGQTDENSIWYDEVAEKIRFFILDTNTVAFEGWASSQFPLKNGTGATGTWGIGISGNASTVTNGVYTTGTNIYTAGANYFKTAITYLRDADGDDGQFLTSLTLDRAWTFPDKDGTVAMTSDLAAYEPALTKGNFTESVTGLSLSATRQVIGGALSLSLDAGYVIPTTTQETNWTAGYNDKINSASFNTSNGVITLTQQDAGTVTVDIDGRYPGLSDNNNWTGVNDFQSDAKFTDDIIKPWETATLDVYGSYYSIDPEGKNSITVTPTSNVTVINISDDVQDGQEVLIMNMAGSYTVTFNETDNLIVPGSSIVLGQRDNVTFKFQSTGGFWICISYVDN